MKAMLFACRVKMPRARDLVTFFLLAAHITQTHVYGNAKVVTGTTDLWGDVKNASIFFVRTDNTASHAYGNHLGFALHAQMLQLIAIIWSQFCRLMLQLVYRIRRQLSNRALCAHGNATTNIGETDKFAYLATSRVVHQVITAASARQI